MLYFIKFLYAWLLPPGCFIIILCLGYYYWYKSNSLKSFLISVLLIYLLSIGVVSDFLIKPLEYAYPQPPINELKEAQAIVILGGGSFSGVPDFDGRGQLAGIAANRYIMGIRLYRKLHLPLILSGGMLKRSNKTRLNNLVRLLKSCGVDEKDIICDFESQNTVSNAYYTKKICDKYDFKNLVLVTAACHMPRSMAIFQREGICVIPYPSDYRTNRSFMLSTFAFTPHYSSLSNTAIAIKEYLGIIAIKLGLQ